MNFEQPPKFGKPKQEEELESKMSKETLLLSYEKPEGQLEKKQEEKWEEHEEYHTVESEHVRHIKFFDFKFKELEWRMHQEALENYDPMTKEIKPSTISPQEAADFIWQQRKEIEKNLLESLQNRKEQETRRKIREELVTQLESIYNSLNKETFSNKNEQVRKEELGKVLKEEGIGGKTKKHKIF